MGGGGKASIPKVHPFHFGPFIIFGVIGRNPPIAPPPPFASFQPFRLPRCQYDKYLQTLLIIVSVQDKKKLLIFGTPNFTKVNGAMRGDVEGRED